MQTNDEFHISAEDEYLSSLEPSDLIAGIIEPDLQFMADILACKARNESLRSLALRYAVDYRTLRAARRELQVMFLGLRPS